MDAELDPSDEAADPAPASRPPMPRWLFVSRWAFAIFVIVGAFLLPLFLLGIRLHVHPWTGWRGDAVPEVAGLDVRLDPDLKISERAVLEVGGTSFVNTPHPQTVEATVTDLDTGGTRLRLAHPSAADTGWKVVLELTQDGPATTHAAATSWRGEEKYGSLTGTLLLNTLDWTSPGEKRCVYALHSTGKGALCFRGSFVVER